MAKYTIELRALMDDPAARARLDAAMSTYPLYQKKSKEEFIPAYIPTREELNKKLLNFYKYREIGFETPARFFDELETALVEIMPRYNLLYMTADQDFNVIWNVDYKREIKRAKEATQEAQGTAEDNSTTNTTSTAQDSTTTHGDAESYNKNVKSSTPQNLLNIPAESINSINYADEATWGKDKSTTNGTSTSEGSTTANSTVKNTGSTTTTGSSDETEDTTETAKGNFGVVSAQDLIQKFRETILNIDQMVINDPRIRELFFTVY